MAAPRERLVEQAIALIVEGEGTTPEAAATSQATLRRWQDRSPEHDAAAREAMRRWEALAGLGDGLRDRFGAPDRPAAGTRRRAVLSLVALLGTGALGAGGARWYLDQPRFSATYTTRPAELLRVTLPDGQHAAEGTRLDLAPRSHLAVALHRDTRRVTMASGEVRFDVAHDPAHPFEVLTSQARIEVVGTVFTVRDRGGPVTVAVERGHVRVRVGDRPPVDLRPGQSLDVRDGRAGTVRQVAVASLSAWRDGWLVFDDTPLDDALATLNAWRPRPIVASDPGVRALRLSGRFRADDSAALLAVLPTILPVTVSARADGTVHLLAR